MAYNVPHVITGTGLGRGQCVVESFALRDDNKVILRIGAIGANVSKKATLNYVNM